MPMAKHKTKDLTYIGHGYGGEEGCAAGGGGFLMLFCNPLQTHEIREALRSEKGYFSSATALIVER